MESFVELEQVVTMALEVDAKTIVLDVEYLLILFLCTFKNDVGIHICPSVF